MSRFVYVLLGWGGVLLVPLTIGLILAAIWIGDVRYGQSGALTFMLALVGLIIFGIWSDEPPERRPPRSERKALHMEEARVRRDAAIRALERELGQ